MVKRRIIIIGLPLVLSFLLFVTAGHAQSCGCPSANDCSPCSGGLVSLKLQYNGDFLALIAVADNSSILFLKILQPGEIFSLSGSQSGGKFSATGVDLFVAGAFDVKINTNCSLGFFPGIVYGNFTILEAKSKSGLMCCTPIAGDQTAPVIANCPDDIEIITTSCSATATWAEPTVADCDLNSFTHSNTPGSEFPIGTAKVTYTATDANNNASTCSFNVIVKDMTAPVVSECPSTITLAADSTCHAKPVWTPPIFTDNCGTVTVRSSHRPGDKFPLGATDVTYTGTDRHGNSTTCTFSVVVEDQSSPKILNCPGNIAVETSYYSDIAVTWPAIKAVDCNLNKTISNYNSGDFFPVGNTTVNFTASDKSGNEQHCSFNVSVTFEPSALEITQIISPDNNGINDVLVIKNIERYESNEVVIADRWGSVIFSATNYDNERIVWNGSNRNGSLVPTGTYFYTISIYAGALVKQKKGFVEIIR
jgi:gliding motility-associated-like protein